MQWASSARMLSALDRKPSARSELHNSSLFIVALQSVRRDVALLHMRAQLDPRALGLLFFSLRLLTQQREGLVVEDGSIEHLAEQIDALEEKVFGPA